MRTSKNIERDTKIRELVKNGLSQSKVAKMYGITQTRVSAIIYNRLPPYHYCRWCHARSGTKSVCEPCRGKVQARIAERVAQTKARKEQEHMARQQKRAEKLQAHEERHRLFLEKRAVESSQPPIICTLCGKLFDSGERRVCFECKERIKTRDTRARCVFCHSTETNGWAACLKCVPYQNMLDPKLQGRDRVRSLVRIRDGHKCQVCGLERRPEEVIEYNSKILNTFKGKMKSLDVHHLNGMCGKNSIGYDSIETLPDLITLCHSCHFKHEGHTIQSKKK